jgi:hypothetical protein
MVENAKNAQNLQCTSDMHFLIFDKFDGLKTLFFQFFEISL